MIEQQKELVAKKYEVWLNSLNEASVEASGEGGTKKRGVYVVTRLKMSIAKTNETDYLRANKDLASLEAKCEKEINNSELTVEKSFNNNAMLYRIQGLFKLINGNPWMMVVYGLVTAFLFMLEFIVVLLKMYLPTTNYEKKIKLIEEIGEKRMERIKQHDEKYYDIGRIQSLNSNGKIYQATSGVFSTFKNN